MDRLKVMERAIKELINRSEDGIPIVVEGKRDLQALRSVGIPGEIHTITGPVISVVEGIHAREVVILTDCDRRGNMLAGRLKQLFLNESIKPNFRIRGMLRFSGIVHMEDIPSLLLKLKNKRR